MMRNLADLRSRLGPTFYIYIYSLHRYGPFDDLVCDASAYAKIRTVAAALRYASDVKVK